MLTHTLIARVLVDALRRIAGAPGIAPLPAVTPRQQKLARLHLRGSLLRVRTELRLVSAAHADDWKLHKLAGGATYRLDHSIWPVHFSLTLVDEQQVVVEWRGRGANAATGSLTPSGWAAIGGALEVWTRELAMLGILMSKPAPGTVAAE